MPGASLPGMSRRLKRDLPGPDRRVDPERVAAEGWRPVFAPELPEPFPLAVEIGFGRGELLIERARAEPERAFVGVELSAKRTLKMARRVARTGLANLRLLAAPGESVVERLLPEASVAAMWVNFPDPWPKRRHHRRRLVRPAFVRGVARALAPGGMLYVATDHPDYACVIDQALDWEPRLENAFAPERFRREVPGRVPTFYESEWRAEGRPLHFWSYRRAAAPAEAAA